MGWRRIGSNGGGSPLFAPPQLAFLASPKGCSLLPCPPPSVPVRGVGLIKIAWPVTGLARQASSTTTKERMLAALADAEPAV